MRVLARLDGTLADPAAPFLRADDLGVLRGDGVFETILVVDREPRELGPHLDRLANSAALLDMPVPERSGWERATRAVIDAWPWQERPEMGLKFVCTRGVDDGDGTPTGYALGIPVGADTLTKREHGVDAISLERGYAPDLKDRAPWLLLSAKSLSYATNMAAMREAARRGVGEVIYLATDDTVLEGPTSNVVLARGRELITPPPNAGILAGTTQGALFRAAERAGWRTRVERFGYDALFDADGVWASGSIRLISRINAVDGTPLPGSPDLHAEIVGLYESEYQRTPAYSASASV